MADDKSLVLEICALDRAPLCLDATEVSVPGTEGIFTVLPGHAPLLSTLELGILNAKLTDGKRHSFAVSGGFCQVLNDHVLVLAQTAEMDIEINLERAQAARERAKSRLEESTGTIDLARAEAALHRALIRIQAAGKTQSLD